MARVRRIAAWLVFPALMGTVTTAMAVAIAHGYNLEHALVVISVAATTAVLLLERILPYRPAWNRNHGDLATDAMHGLVTLVVLPAAVQALCFAGTYRAGSWLTEALGTPLWPSEWPLAAQFGLALLITEFAHYWIHRAMHRWPLLWRVHSIHHSAPRLYWLNSARVHVLDALVTLAVSMLVLVVLGAPQATQALFLGYTGVHATLQHSNVDIRIGWLNWLCAQAELHRWHHSPSAAESNHNYGVTLIIWDALFGTRYLPAGREPPVRTGIAELPDFPTGYYGQLLAPIHFRRFGT